MSILDFELWSNKKCKIDQSKKRVFFHEREIWFTSFGQNIGFEQNGKGVEFLRPILVIKKFNNDLLWCLPLTRSEKKGRYYFAFILNGRMSIAILSQIRLVDSKRLQYKIGKIDRDIFAQIKEKLKLLLE
jgi:mRNA-degrading endonuclease toxin of MazEF toxin-antitoxin module